MPKGLAKKTPTYIILLSISHGNSCFAFVNGSSQTIACGLLRYSRCIASVQKLLQSDSTGSEIKGRMGWGVEGGWCCFYSTIFQHITVWNSTVWFWFISDCQKVVQPNICLAQYQCFNPKKNFNNNWLAHKSSIANSSLMHKAKLCRNQ